MSSEISIGQSAQALYQNIERKARRGYTVSSGCAVSINSGNLGSSDTLSVASGSVWFGGSSVSVSSQNVQIDASDSDPRKDVVYLDGTGTAQVAKGTPGETPTVQDDYGATRFEYIQPEPPALDGTNAIVLAEVWVPAGGSTISSADVADRRVDPTGLGEINVENATVQNAPSASTDVVRYDDAITLDDWNIVDASKHGYPGDRSGGDIMQLIRDNPNSAIVLPRGEYSMQSTIDSTTDDGWDQLAVIGKPHARIVVEDTSAGYFADLGSTSGGAFQRLKLENLTLVVDGANDYDAGWGRWNIDERVECKNLSIEGQRDYWNGGDGSGNPAGGDKFSYFCNMVTEQGVGIHQNINLPDGDTPYDSQAQQDHAVGFGSEPAHVGTQFWIGCNVEEYWDNGYYVKDGDGPNILKGCRAANCGGANIRLGAYDIAIGCQSNWNYDLGNNDGVPGALLDSDDARGTAVMGFRGVNDTSTTDAVRIRSSSEEATFSDLYIENNTSQYALAVRSTSGTHEDGILKMDNVRVIDTGDTSTRVGAVQVQRPNVHLSDISIDTTGGTDRYGLKVHNGSVRVDGISNIKTSASNSVIFGHSGGGQTITRAILDGVDLSGGFYEYSGDNTIESVHVIDCDLRDIGDLFGGGSRSNVGTFIARDNLGLATENNGTQSGAVAIDATGTQTIAGISHGLYDTPDIGDIDARLTNPTQTDWDGHIAWLSNVTSTSFDVTVSITSASGTSGATADLSWSAEM